MIVVLDNHDSYTFNLFQLLQEQTARRVRVVSSTAADEAVALLRGGEATGLVVSPGPGHPAVAGDFAGSALAVDAALELGVPVLGVCLGHQGIALRFGCRVDRAPRARHGWVSPLRHSGAGLFAGIPQGTRVTRYHSLAIVEPIPADARIEVTARSEDGVVQAFDVVGAEPAPPASHGHAGGAAEAGAARRVIARGVQFHPESIATEHGRELLANALAWFEDVAAERARAAAWATAGAGGPDEAGGAASGRRGEPTAAMRAGGRGAAAAAGADDARLAEGAAQLAPASSGGDSTAGRRRRTRILTASVLTVASAAGARDEAVEAADAPAAPPTGAAALAIYARAIARRRGSFWIDRAEGDARAPRWSVLGDAVPLPAADSGSREPDSPFGAVPKGESGSASEAPGVEGLATGAVAPGDPARGPFVVRMRRGAATLDAWADATGPVRRSEMRAHPSGGAAASDFDSLDLLDVLVGPARGRVVGGEGLPFRGGVAGFLGYDEGVRLLGQGDRSASTPDAVWIVPHRWIVVDHATGEVTACARVDLPAEGGPDAPSQGGAPGAEASAGQQARSIAAVQARLDAWTSQIRAVLTEATGPAASTEPNSPFGTVPKGETGARDAEPSADRLAPGSWALSPQEYRDRIRESVEEMLAGETYEVCLTNEFRVDASIDPDALELFAHVRRHDAVPYAALLELDDDGERLDVVSASPERFLRGTADGRYETKPIKGTARRTGDPEEDARAIAHLLGDAKTFAEHLMIVDLLRNDLGRVSEPGTVEVPSLMHIESFETVHQLVSTVRGRAPGVPTAEVVRALFPGGSMTGAPKERTLSIIDRLEGRPRGVYSGALGTVGLDGSCDLSIVIRTAVRDGRGWTIGAGGAIVLDSDPDAEIAEVELKASSLRRALAAVSARAGAAAPTARSRAS